MKLRHAILEALGECHQEKVKAVVKEEKRLDCFEAKDKDWLTVLADKGNLYAACCLLQGMNRKEHSWIEAFTDEDTNEEVEILRYEVEDGTTFEKDEELEMRLTQQLYDAKEQMSDEELKTIWRYSLPIDNTPLTLARIRRGDEKAASYIEDPTILQNLCDKGNKYAAYELYHKYMWGDEEHGIFISKENAKPYFDLAMQRDYEFNDEELNELNEPDEPGEECPEGFRYTLTGDSSTLQAVHTLIDDLCQRFGTPGNELGLYVPQRMLMKVLVGSDTEYYRGNVITMTQEAPDRLIIETEADSGEPLLYALRCSFPNIEVEMEEYELF